MYDVRLSYMSSMRTVNSIVNTHSQYVCIILYIHNVDLKIYVLLWNKYIEFLNKRERRIFSISKFFSRFHATRVWFVIFCRFPWVCTSRKYLSRFTTQQKYVFLPRCVRFGVRQCNIESTHGENILRTTNGSRCRAGPRQCGRAITSNRVPKRNIYIFVCA